MVNAYQIEITENISGESGGQLRAGFSFLNINGYHHPVSF